MWSFSYRRLICITSCTKFVVIHISKHQLFRMQILKMPEKLKKKAKYYYSQISLICFAVL